MRMKNWASKIARAAGLRSQEDVSSGQNSERGSSDIGWRRCGVPTSAFNFARSFIKPVETFCGLHSRSIHRSMETLEPQLKENIEVAAAQLNEWRENWLNPEDWMKEETIEFRASENGPWHRYLAPGSVGADGIGVAHWTRLVAAYPRRPVQDFRYDPKMKQFRNFAVTTEDALSHRTLTNLYNHPPAWLQSAHRNLDEAVFAAYGWPADLGDDEILERLLALNLERAQAEVNTQVEAEPQAEVSTTGIQTNRKFRAWPGATLSIG